MRRLTVGCLVALTVGLVSAGCDNVPSTPTTPTGPAETITETFVGTVGPNGAQTFTFQTTSQGFLTATLTAFAPDTGLTVGLAIGTFNGITCQSIITNDTAQQNATVTGNASAAGSLCVRIYDARQTLTQTNLFEIVVVHP
jgi:hypothetical protein